MEKASEIIKSLPERFKADKAVGVNTRFHFEIEGETGGHFTAIVVDGVCTVEEGLNGEAKCIVRAKATDYEDVELGRTNPQMAEDYRYYRDYFRFRRITLWSNRATQHADGPHADGRFCETGSRSNQSG